MSAVSLDSRVYSLEQEASSMKSDIASIKTMQIEQTKDTAQLDQRITDLIRTLGAVAGALATLAVTIAIAILTILTG